MSNQGMTRMNRKKEKRQKESDVSLARAQNKAKVIAAGRAQEITESEQLAQDGQSGQSRPAGRHDCVRVPHPLTFPAICAAAGLIFFVPGALRLLPYNVMRYLMQMFLYMVLGQAWNLLGGFAGLTSLGQQLYIALAGFSLAVITSKYQLPLPVGILTGLIISLAAALLAALLLFRMNGMYFSVASWVIAEAVSLYFLSWPFVNQGGGMTVSLYPYPDVRSIYLGSVVLGIAALLAVYALLRSKAGLAWMCMRDDPGAAMAAGVNIRKYRLLAFLVSAALCALAGSWFFVNKGVIYPDSGFSISWTISTVFIVIIGGSGTIAGPIAGSVLYVILQEFLAHYPGWSNMLLGGITILVIMFMPAGIIGTMYKKLGIEAFETRRSPEPPQGRRSSMRAE